MLSQKRVSPVDEMRINPGSPELAPVYSAARTGDGLAV